MNAWLIAGWTMLHFLSVGTAMAALGAALRIAVRRGSPNLRYAASLATLAAVACSPAVIAAVLAWNPAWMPTTYQPLALPLALPVDGAAPGTASASAPSNAAIAQGIPRQSRGLSSESAPRTFVELKGLVEGQAAGQGGTPQSAQGVETRPIAPRPRPAANLGRATQLEATGPENPALHKALGPDVLQRVVSTLPYAWLVGAPITFLLLAAGLIGSRSLTRSGRPLAEGPAAEACARLCAALKVSQRVALAAVEGLAQPVLVGIVKPTILLPAAALNGLTVEELEMVLLHELAHVRRWDNLTNLVQRVVEAALFFHPCVWLASRQVRRDREECCDWVVVQHTQRPEAYAELLVNVASSSRSEPGRPRPRLSAAVIALASASPMAQHALVGRVRRILKLEDEPMWVSRRTVGLLVVLMLGTTAAVYQAAFATPPVMVTGGGAAESADLETKEYSAEDMTRISGNWGKLMSMGSAEGAKFKWNGKTGSTTITASPALHALVKLILEGKAKDFPKYTFSVSGPRELMDRVRQLEREFAAENEEHDSTPSSETAYRLVPGDHLMILSRGLPADRAIGGDYEVDDEGMIGLRPPYTRVKVAGLTDVEAEAAIVKSISLALKEVLEEPPQVWVQIMGEVLGPTSTVAESGTLSPSPAEASAQSASPGPDGSIPPEPAVNVSLAVVQSPRASDSGVMAYLEVRAQGAASLSELEWERVASRIPALLLSEQVLQGAFNFVAPKFDRLQKIAQDRDEVSWLHEQLKFSFTDASPILELQMPVDEDGASVALMSAVIAELEKQLHGQAPGETHVHKDEAADGSDEIELQVTSDWSAVLDGISISRDDLPTVLADRKGGVPQVRLRADTTRPYTDVTAWMNALHDAGVRAVSVAHDTATQPAAKTSNADAARWTVADSATASGPDAHAYVRHNDESGLGRMPAEDIALLGSEQVLEAALSEAGRVYPDIWHRTDGVAWLRRRLLYNYDAGLATLQIRLSCAGGATDQDIRVLNEVVTAFCKQTEKVDVANALKSSGAPHRIGPGDKLLVRAVNLLSEAPVDGAFIVEDEGTLALGPWYERVHVAGLTVREAEAAVLKVLAEVAEAPRVQVTLAEKAQGSSPELTAPTSDDELKPDKLAPGDVIAVHVLGTLPDEPINAVMVIEDEGTIALGPTYGRVAVVGLTVSESEQAIEAHLRSILQEPRAQVTLRRNTVGRRTVPTRAATGSQIQPPPDDRDESAVTLGVGRKGEEESSAPIPLYDGKTFDEWRVLWRTELKVAKRLEAVEALAAFARAGYGREAAEALLDVAGQYDFTVLDDGAEGKLKQRIIELLVGYPKPIPSSDWLPALIERFKADPDKWRSLMREVLSGVSDADEAMQTTILELKDDPKYDVALAAWRALVTSARNSGKQDEGMRLLREGLASASAEIRTAALSWTGFDRLEEFPELFEMLFAEDPQIALEARQQLGRTRERSRAVLAERLWKVVDDPERVASRVQALRAIGVLYATEVMEGGSPKESERAWRADTANRLLTRVNTGPRDELAAAAWSLDDQWEAEDRWVERGRVSKERMEEVLALREAIAEERAAAMGPPQFGQPGSGGGFF